jgi:hypothetical protein
MADKKMLIVDAEVARKVDESRGEMSRSDFIDLLIESQLSEDKESRGGVGQLNYVTKEELHQSLQGIKELLRTFLEFFLSYGLEVGKHSDKNFNELSQKLQALVNSKGQEKNHD